MGLPSGKEAVDNYIMGFPANIQVRLKQLRQVIRDAAPNATEVISYQMPTLKLNGNLVHFAAFNKHIGFYPTPSAITAFKEELTQYHTSKGAIQFPHDKPIPYELVKEIVIYRVKENSG
jgi:uncharacterized protein YdhG (YjbR/CyaY superfamily)